MLFSSEEYALFKNKINKKKSSIVLIMIQRKEIGERTKIKKGQMENKKKM